MIPAVNVNLVNGNIGGSPNTFDRVVGQVITGLGTGTIALLRPCRFVSLADAEFQGLTAAAEPEAHTFVKDFYNDAPKGSTLYLMLFANTNTIQTMCDKTNANGAKKLIDFATTNAGGQIRVCGISRTPSVGYTPVTAEFIDSDAHLALPNALALQQMYFTAHTPLRIIIGARVVDVTNATIFAPNTATNNAVALAIGNNVGGPGVSMGTILAKVAATDPQVNIGRVKDGALNISNWYIQTLPITPVVASGQWYQQINTLINAGYITCTTYAGKAGFFISDDPMCTSNADDYQSLANARVIDKASIVAYQSFLHYLNSEVDLVAGGTLDPAEATDMQSKIANDLGLALAGNISGKPNVIIDTTQVIVAGTPFIVQLRILPKGYLKSIEIDLGFSF